MLFSTPDTASIYMMSMALMDIWTSLLQSCHSLIHPFQNLLAKIHSRLNHSIWSHTQYPLRCSLLLSSPSSCLWPLLRLLPGISLVLAPQTSPVKSIPNTQLQNFLRSVETETDALLGLAMVERVAAHLPTPSARMCGNVRGTTNGHYKL